MFVDETLHRLSTQWRRIKDVWRHTALNRDRHEIFIQLSSRFIRELVQGNLQRVMPITAVWSPRTFELSRLSIASSYGLPSSTNSFVDPGFVNEHPGKNPAIPDTMIIHLTFSTQQAHSRTHDWSFWKNFCREHVNTRSRWGNAVEFRMDVDRIRVVRS